MKDCWQRQEEERLGYKSVDTDVKDLDLLEILRDL